MNENEITKQVIITLDPTKMVNPDADIRYELPDMIEDELGDCLEIVGFDYNNNGNMIIVINCEDLDLGCAKVKKFCSNARWREQKVSEFSEVDIQEIEI